MIKTTRPKKETTERFNCILNAKLKEQANEKAKKEGRTLTDVFTSFLNEYVKKATEQEQIDDLTQRVNQCEERLTALEKKEG